MIILDTNVISETYRDYPEDRVVDWLASLDRSRVTTTAVNIAELRMGVAIMPEGRKRKTLQGLVDNTIASIGVDRIEVFSATAAYKYGEVCGERHRIGRPIETEDAMIAAICIARGATLATRNTKDFDGLRMTLINPWEYRPGPPVA
ncbi:type II toxin-antitoxin system VapC family toxin [Glycomyces sp. NPDC048151]|uniref:type II toxin-antitoxin system VapC family toxin n=1 Tax=Glycomyces sp. NPDC048151 TaxID=3364002 RepID=UPI00371A3E92